MYAFCKPRYKERGGSDEKRRRPGSHNNGQWGWLRVHKAGEGGVGGGGD